MVPPALASHYASDEATLPGPRRAAVQVARAWPQPLTDSQQTVGSQLCRAAHSLLTLASKLGQMLAIPSCLRCMSQ